MAQCDEAEFEFETLGKLERLELTMARSSLISELISASSLKPRELTS